MTASQAGGPPPSFSRGPPPLRPGSIRAHPCHPACQCGASPSTRIADALSAQLGSEVLDVARCASSRAGKRSSAFPQCTNKCTNIVASYASPRTPHGGTHSTASIVRTKPPMKGALGDQHPMRANKASPGGWVPAWGVFSANSPSKGV